MKPKSSVVINIDCSVKLKINHSKIKIHILRKHENADQMKGKIKNWRSIKPSNGWHSKSSFA